MATSIKIDNELKGRGQHLTGLEVRDWLNTWGSATAAELPPCHA